MIAECFEICDSHLRLRACLQNVLMLPAEMDLGVLLMELRMACVCAVTAAMSRSACSR